MKAVLGITIWTALVWLLAAAGMQGLALVAAFAALVHAALVAVRSLNRDNLCHVCGRHSTMLTLGACGPCRSDLRVRG